MPVRVLFTAQATSLESIYIWACTVYTQRNLSHPEARCNYYEVPGRWMADALGPVGLAVRVGGKLIGPRFQISFRLATVGFGEMTTMLIEKCGSSLAPLTAGPAIPVTSRFSLLLRLALGFNSLHLRVASGSNSSSHGTRSSIPHSSL